MILETFANGSKPLEIEEDDKNCYFRNDNAALSLCKGIVSILPFFILYLNLDDYMMVGGILFICISNGAPRQIIIADPTSHKLGFWSWNSLLRGWIKYFNSKINKKPETQRFRSVDLGDETRKKKYIIKTFISWEMQEFLDITFLHMRRGRNGLVTCPTNSPDPKFVFFGFYF